MASRLAAEMRGVRRIEGSAEQADPHSGRVRRKDKAGRLHYMRQRDGRAMVTA